MYDQQAAMDRFLSKIERIPFSDCWIWTDVPATRGQPIFYLDGRNMIASRASWLLHRGSIPIGAFICHTCDVKCCVNPNHLYIGDIHTNSADALARNRFYNSKKTHCNRGHEFTPENTYVRKSRPGRECKICRKLELLLRHL